MLIHRLDDYQSWLIQSGSTRVAVDPWHSSRLAKGPAGSFFRRERAPGTYQQTPAEVDALFVSAPFLDHLIPESLQRYPRGTPIYCPASARRALRRLGFADIRVVQARDEVCVGALTLRFVAPGFPYRGPSLGVVFRDSLDRSVYLETHVVDAKIDAIKDLGRVPDVVLLPVEHTRLMGVRFAMSADEAAQCLERLGARWAVPTGTDPRKSRGLLPSLLRFSATPEDLGRSLARCGATARVAQLHAGDIFELTPERNFAHRPVSDAP